MYPSRASSWACTTYLVRNSGSSWQSKRMLVECSSVSSWSSHWTKTLSQVRSPSQQCALNRVEANVSIPCRIVGNQVWKCPENWFSSKKEVINDMCYHYHQEKTFCIGYGWCICCAPSDTSQWIPQPVVRAYRYLFALKILAWDERWFSQFFESSTGIPIFLPPLPCSARDGAKFLAAGEKFGEMYGNFSWPRRGKGTMLADTEYRMQRISL